MRKTDDMCDITIKSIDDSSHRAHSIVLAAASPVFKVMVTREFKEYHSREINLKCFEGAMVELVLEYIYTGEIKISNDSVVDIFSVAHQFELIPLLEECKEYITHGMDTNNCFGILKLGDCYDHPELTTEAKKYLLHNFQEFSSSEEFFNFKKDELLEYLKDDELNVHKEEDLLDIIFGWIDHDYLKRVSYVSELLQCARFPLMSYEFVINKLKQHPRLSINKELVTLRDTIVEQCYDIFNDEEVGENYKPSMDCLTLKHRIPVEMIFLLGGWTRGRTLDIAECYNTNSKEWFVTRHLQDPNGGRCYFGMEIVEGNIYVIGGYCGKMYMNTVRKFNPRTHCWIDVAPMHFRRCFTTTVILNNEVFVIGGYDGSRRLSSVEKYSSLMNQWTLLKSLNTPRSDCASVIHNDKIYLFGGYGGDSLCTCETYSAETDSWRYLMQMQCRRSGACAVSLKNENKIMVLGGYNGTVRVRTTEIYDPETNTWTYGPSMLRERSNFTTCFVKNQLLVIGGYTGHMTLSDVELFDLDEWKWSKIGEINCARSAMKAVLLHNLPNIKDYFEGGEQMHDDGSVARYNKWPHELNFRKIQKERLKELGLD